jgi:hypothetical protein
MESSPGFIERLPHVWILAQVGQQLQAQQYILVSVRTSIANVDRALMSTRRAINGEAKAGIVVRNPSANTASGGHISTVTHSPVNRDDIGKGGR